MPTLARHLPLTALQPGMVLAKPLITSHAGYLEDGLPTGHVLTVGCLDKLRRGHTEVACIEEEDLRSDAEREASHVAQAARLATIFRHAPAGHGPTRELRAMLLAHRSAFAQWPVEPPACGPQTAPDQPSTHASAPALPATPARGALDPNRPAGAPLARAVTVAEITARLGALPAFPTVVRDVLATLDDEDSHLRTLSEHLAHDPVLGAQVLSLANRPHGHLGSEPVRDLYTAVTLVGMRRIRGIVTSVALVDFVRHAGCSAAFWQHSLAVAIAAEELARLLGLPREQALVAGLLHDIGALWLRTGRPGDLALLRGWHAEHGGRREDAERAVFGMDHATIGRHMAALWRLPPEVGQAIGAHNTARRDELTPLVAATHLAELICLGLDLPPREDNLIDNLSDAAWSALGPDGLEALPDLLGVIEARYAFESAALAPPEAPSDAEPASSG